MSPSLIEHFVSVYSAQMNLNEVVLKGLEASNA